MPKNTDRRDLRFYGFAAIAEIFRAGPNSMTRRRKHSVCVPFAFPRMDLDRLRLSYPPLSAIFTGRGELRLAFRKHWNYWNVWNVWNGLSCLQP
jgi:hypothetical protein